MSVLRPFPSLNITAPAEGQGAWKIFLATCVALLGLTVIAGAQTHSPAPASVTDASPATDELVIDETTSGNVYALGRNVVVRGKVEQGVMALGGDVVVEGRVEGDVAAIGGSVRQREGSFIGGDVMVIGGAYHHGKQAPGRNASSTTVMYAGYEQELRDIARNPATLIAPRPSLAYLGQRLMAVLFWFVVSLALTAVAPNVVSRASTRLQLTSLRVAVIGLLASLVLSYGVVAALRFLPSALGALVGITALLLLVVAYLFGRVVIHAATGRWLQRLFWKEEKHSESIALLLGAIFWAGVLSLPYVWTVVVGGLLVTSLGLSFTARYRFSWKQENS